MIKAPSVHVQGMASSMGGSLLPHSAAAHPQQPGQYRGAAALDVPDGPFLFADYGTQAGPQLLGSHLASDLLGTAAQVPSGNDAQLHTRNLSNGSDFTGPASPRFRHVDSCGAALMGGPAVHSRQSSGWTGFDGPAFSGADLMGTSMAGQSSGAVTAGGLTATNADDLPRPVAIEQQQQLISLHAVRQGSHVQSHGSDLRSQLQRTSLSNSDSELQHDGHRLPSHVFASLFDNDGSGIHESHKLPLQAQSGQDRILSASDLGSMHTEDRFVPTELIGNLDLYL